MKSGRIKGIIPTVIALSKLNLANNIKPSTPPTKTKASPSRLAKNIVKKLLFLEVRLAVTRA